MPKGGPDGGDGGRGGDVVLVADPALRDLSALQRRRWIAAAKGGNGRGARKHGADGETIEVHVPASSSHAGAFHPVATVATAIATSVTTTPCPAEKSAPDQRDRRGRERLKRARPSMAAM